MIKKLLVKYKILSDHQKQALKQAAVAQLLGLQLVIVLCILRHHLIPKVMMFCFSWERTDIIQITNITFYYNRFSTLTNDSLKSMGRFRIQWLLEDNKWST